VSPEKNLSNVQNEAPEARLARKFGQQTFPMGAEQLFPWDKALSTSDAIEDVERIEADRSRWSRL
jgi:hypothetical protein